jgi:hypothetical protein
MPIDVERFEREREALRASTTALLVRAAADPSVPHLVLEILSSLAKRLDRLELPFTEAEAPTRPDRKPSSSALPAVKGPFVEAVEILDEAKKRKDSR